MTTEAWLVVVALAAWLVLFAVVLSDFLWFLSLRRAKADVRQAMEMARAAALLPTLLDRHAAYDDADRMMEDAAVRLAALRKQRPWRRV